MVSNRLQDVQFHRKILFSLQARFRRLTFTGLLATQELLGALAIREGLDNLDFLEILETPEYQGHQGWDSLKHG